MTMTSFGEGVVVGVDVDMVTANTFPVWLHRAELKLGRTYQLKDIYGEAANKDEEFIAMLSDPSLYDDVEPLPGALVGVEALRSDGFRPVFVSSNVMGMRDAKVEWLMSRGFLPRTNRQQHDWIDAHDKSLIGVDIMVDDLPKNLEGFVKRAILFNQPYNHRSHRNEGLWTRVDDWREVQAIVRFIRERHVVGKHFPYV